MPRQEGAETMRPLLAIVTRRYWYGIRFGLERYKSFSERYQGTRGIPILWHYWLGGRISFTRTPIPDDRQYPRFQSEHTLVN